MLVLKFGSIRQFLVYFSSTLLGLVILASCTLGGSFESYLASGKAALAKKDYNAAVIQFKNAAQKKPTDAEARYLLAKAYIETGNFLAAEKELRQAQQFKFDTAKTSAALGRALLLQTKFRELLDEIQADPGYPPAELAEIFVTRGLAYLNIAQPTEARASLEQARKLAPQLASAELGLVQVLAAENKLAEAQTLNNQLLVKHPTYALAWSMQGDLLAAQTQADQALVAYKKAIELEPDYVMANIKLASLLTDSKQLPKAQAHMEKIKKIAPNHPLTHQLQARIYYLQGNYSAAEDAIQSALKADSDYVPTLLLAGAIAHAKGLDQQAEKYLSSVVSQYPSHSYARKLLATIQVKLGRMQNALATLKPLLSQPLPDAGSLFLAGEAHMALREYSRANEYFSKASAADPKNALLRTSLGKSQLAAGEEAEAIKELEASSAMGDKAYQADITLAYHFLAQGQFDKALAAIAVLEKKLPDSPGTYNLKGQAYMGKKDFVQARKNFERALVLKPNLVSAAVRLAVIDLQEKNLPAARSRYQAILDQDSKSIPAMVGMAELAALEKKEQEYLSWLERAAKASPASFLPRALMANYYLSKGEPQKAITVAKEALAGRPNSAEALDLLGRVQQAAGEKENALATYTQLVTLAPKSASAHYHLAKAHAAMGDDKATRSVLGKALEIKPDYAEALSALSALAARRGDHVEAIRVARELQTRHANSPLGYALEGDALMMTKRYPEAARLYERALAKTLDSRLAVKRHMALSRAGDAKKADDLLLAWLKAYPQDQTVRARLAESYTQRRLKRQAIEQYQILLAASPNNTEALNNLAVLYQEERDPRALAMAEKVYKLKPDNPLHADTLGWILVQQGQSAKGLQLIEKAAAQAPTHPEIRFHLASALAKAGQSAQARQQVTQLQNMKLSPELEEVKLLMQQIP